METSTANPAAPANPGPMTDESDFLQQQADEARAALAATLAEAAAALKQGVDPSVWTRRFPLVAIGSALLAGFATAAATVPSKEQQELKKLEKLARALRPAAGPATEPAASAAARPSEGPAKPMWVTLLHEALNLLRPALVSLLSAYFGSNNGSPHGPNVATEPGNGRTPPQARSTDGS